MAPRLAELMGEKVTVTNGAKCTHFAFENGGGFGLFHTSTTTPEHIVGCIKSGRALQSVRQVYDAVLDELLPPEMQAFLDRM